MRIVTAATESAFPQVPAVKEAYCLKCGHCEAFLPAKSLNSGFSRQGKALLQSTGSFFENRGMLGRIYQNGNRRG